MVFNFNLQKVLDVRNIQEDIAQHKFLQARQEEKELESKLQEMNKKQQNLYNYIRKDLQSVERALQARQFLQYNRRKIQNQRQKLNVKRKEVEEKQEEMVKKQKKRKVLEKLKDKKYHQFQKDFMHDLQKKLDEVGQQSYMKEGV